jgi:hypothetical protein
LLSGGGFQGHSLRDLKAVIFVSWGRDFHGIADLAEFGDVLGAEVPTCYGGGMGALWRQYGGGPAAQRVGGAKMAAKSAKKGFLRTGGRKYEGRSPKAENRKGVLLAHGGAACAGGQERFMRAKGCRKPGRKQALERNPGVF